MNISEMYRNLSGIQPGLKTDTQPAPRSDTKKVADVPDFSSVLQGQVDKLVETDRGFKLSNHAETRIRSREIPWSADLEQRVRTGMDSAESKGSREALILAGPVAIIANVPTRTVITAMDSANLKERIFTNIDSAVLV